MAFALTSEWDDLYKRGYPHLRRLVDGHADDAKAADKATKVLDLRDPAIYHVDWPREVAHRFVRALAHVGEHGIGFAASLAAGDVKAAKKGLETAGPVHEAEGRSLIAKLVDPELNHYDFIIVHGLLLLEAMIGSEAVVDAVLKKLELLKSFEGTYSTLDVIAYELGFVLRRLDPSARASAEKRIRALIASDKADDYTKEFLSFIVDGGAALSATDRKLGPYCVHFADDPKLIERLAREQKGIRVDANHVLLAGDGVVDALIDGVKSKKIWPWRQPLLIEELEHVASARVDDLLKELAKKGATAKRAESALAKRAALRGGKPAPAVKPTRVPDTVTATTSAKPKATASTNAAASTKVLASTKPTEARATASAKPKAAASTKVATSTGPMKAAMSTKPTKATASTKAAASTKPTKAAASTKLTKAAAARNQRRRSRAQG